MIFIDKTVRLSGEELYIFYNSLKLTLNLAVTQAEEGAEFNNEEVAVHLKIVEMLADLESSEVLEN